MIFFNEDHVQTVGWVGFLKHFFTVLTRVLLIFVVSLSKARRKKFSLSDRFIVYHDILDHSLYKRSNFRICMCKF
jgi:hypothetical protein